MELTKEWTSYKIGESLVEIRRLESGIPEIKAETALDLQRGLGFVHAADRLMQMLVTRIVSRGELTKYFLDNDEGFAVDFLVRKLGFRRNIVQDLQKITPEALAWTEAYCEGVNAYLMQQSLPLLCKIFRMKDEPWLITDAMLIVKTLSYLGIAQQQERIERLIIHAIRDGVDPEKIKRLFGLDALDETLIELVKKLHVSLPFFDSQMRFQPFQGAMSNNWVIASQKSASGAPLLCVDPHLQINRLPASWYEVSGQWGKGNYRVGITLPGFPGWIMGRSRDLSATFTYGMLDTIDFFIEEIRRGQYKRGEEWISLAAREEKVHRKNREVTLYFFESDAGIIERENSESPLIEDGFYLSMAWSNYQQGPSAIINCLLHLWNCKNVDEAQMYLWNMPLPCNWVLADSSGNIGFQQSGRLPKRKRSGLLPLPAWDRQNLWEGFYVGTELMAEINPSCGFALSANDNKNCPGLPPFSTIHLPDYRYRRLVEKLSEKKAFTIEEMAALQNDCCSLQAADLMELMRKWIPETSVGSVLKKWDYFYHKESQGAVLFESIYRELLREIFAPMFGKEAWKVYGPGHAFFGFNFGNFDRVLLSDNPLWFGSEGKELLFRRTIEAALVPFEGNRIPTWGEMNAFNMNYLLFDGKLPRFLGFDIGPIQLNGNRATVDTFQIYLEGKRKIVTAASYRFITDMSDHVVYSALAGGVNEKKRSPYYTSDIALWRKGAYKKILFRDETSSFHVSTS